jgi:hypothetical protein
VVAGNYDPAEPGPGDYDDDVPAVPDFRNLARSLRDAWDGATAQPGTLEKLIYAGKATTITAPPESGKTVLALHFAIAAMRLGRNVLYWDEEIGKQQTAGLLQSLGAEPELVDKHMVYVPFAGLTWTPRDARALAELVRGADVRLAIFDSSAAMMGAAGVNENDNGDVTRFWQKVWLPLVQGDDNRKPCATVVIDHDGRGEAGQASRYSRGASAKLAIPDVAFKLSPIVPFTRVQDGLLQLTVTKDRPGWLHRHWKIRVRHDPLACVIKQAVVGELSPAARRVFEVLAGARDGLTQQQVGDVLADSDERPMRRETISRALNRLLTSRLVDRFDHGGAVYWQPTGRTLEDAAAENRPAPPEQPGNGWPPDSIGSEANGG